MTTLDGVPLDRITDGPITIAPLLCGCVKFYATHDITVNHPVLCTEPGQDHPTGHGVTAVEDLVCTNVARVSVEID